MYTWDRTVGHKMSQHLHLRYNQVPTELQETGKRTTISVNKITYFSHMHNRAHAWVGACMHACACVCVDKYECMHPCVHAFNFSSAYVMCI